MELEKVYVVTMWSGGKPSRKWKTLQEPELLPQGTGMEFVSMDTKLTVKVIGSLSVEEYEQGSPELFFVDSKPPEAGVPAEKEGRETSGDAERDDPPPSSGPNFTVL